MTSAECFLFLPHVCSESQDKISSFSGYFLWCGTVQIYISMIIKNTRRNYSQKVQACT
jgi:hypothetical protein